MNDALPHAMLNGWTSHSRLLDEGMQRLDIGVSIYDADLHLEVCNQAFGRILDLPEDCLQPGAPLEKVLRLLAERGAYGKVEVEEFVDQALVAMRTVAEPFTFERRTLDGRVFESHTSRLATGGCLTIHTDITHHKEAEARLRESQQELADKTAELELILENASLGIVTVEPVPGGLWQMRRANRTLGELLGYTASELEGRSMRLLFLDDAEYARVAAGYSEITGSGKPYRSEHVFTRKNGSTLTGILRGSAIDPQSPARGAIWLIEDVTERKRIQAELIAKSALLQAGTENMPGAMAIWDAELRYLWWTPRAEEFFNLPSGTLKVGMHLSTVVRFFAERGDYGPGDVERQIDVQMQPFFQRKSMVTQRQMPDGRVIESRRNPLPDGGYVSVFQDITAHTQLQLELGKAKDAAERAVEALHRQQKQVRALLDNSGQGFLSFGRDLLVQEEYSRACEGMFQVIPGGADIVSLLFPADLAAARQLRSQLVKIFDEPDYYVRSFGVSILPRECQIGERVLLTDFRLLDDGDLMLVLTDVTAERRFMALSNTDRLTGLANRRRLEEVLAEECERSARTGLALTVIMADIDHFKRINDTWGHPVGDQILAAIAGILREKVRKVDRPGRWGGEEFMVICPDTGLEGGQELAEKLRQAVAGHAFSVAGRQSCSFGVATLHPGESVESLVSCADVALYRAKHQGRNRVCASFGD